jgi:hypothetical protein
MANTGLRAAKVGKNDEFYTQFPDIEKEMSAYLAHDSDVFRGKTVLLPCDDPEWSHFTEYFLMNFEALGLRKLISTSYAPERKPVNVPTSNFESTSPQYDPSKDTSRGKIFTVSRDTIRHTPLTLGDLEWRYLDGDGDFRSDEVTRLRDEADIIITNPPFSLFREFLAWIVDAKKQFSIIGSMNAITYKEVFPLIKDNIMWLGQSIHSGDREFRVPESYPLEAAGWRIDEDGNRYIRVKGVRWFTNIDHDRRHEPLSLMTMERNIKHSKHQAIKDAGRYLEYDNYDAIDVSFTDAIPSDYDGMMGVPISFLDRYNPDQFEILGVTQRNDDPYKTKRYDTSEYSNANDLNARGMIIVDGTPRSIYARILIKHKKSASHG